MFERIPEQAEADLDREAFNDAQENLRLRLITAQQDLADSGHNLIVVICGDDRPGKNRLINQLREWLDPRGLDIHSLDEDLDPEGQRPPHWRYWQRMPAYGKVAIFYRSWVEDAFDALLSRRHRHQDFRRNLQHCRDFERHLAQDRSHLVKFFVHLPDRAQERRIKKARKRPEKHYRFHPRDIDLYRYYRDGRGVIAEALEATDTAEAPWHMLDSRRRRTSQLSAAESILTAMQAACAKQPQATASYRQAAIPDRLATIDLQQAIAEDAYGHQLREVQVALNRLTFAAHERNIASVFVFEGVDAAGKGGAIKRLCSAVSAELYEIVPIGAPTPDELNHHYLWRFWHQIPQPGAMKIFDRSWYGRVLVERVEGFCSTADWQRAYEEINEFEQQLVDHGIVVEKFWLHIDQDEQLERFRAREATPHKRHKITDEDYRNRNKWPRYRDAANEMLLRTDRSQAPWHLIPANDKKLARVLVLQRIRDALDRALG